MDSLALPSIISFISPFRILAQLEILHKALSGKVGRICSFNTGVNRSITFLIVLAYFVSTLPISFGLGNMAICSLCFI